MLSKKTLQTLSVFLGRTQLQGSEVAAFNEVMAELSKEVEALGAEEESTEE